LSPKEAQLNGLHFLAVDTPLVEADWNEPIHAWKAV